MSRKCELTGIIPQFGNNVSHSQRKTRRRFEPNIKTISYLSDITGQKYRFKVTTKAIRTVEKCGGFDAYILAAKDSIMSDKAQQLKKEISRKKKELTA
jgi:large subunit ribosomal protein L28